MNSLDILNFLTPDFSDLLQASFFCVMLAMLSLTVLSVHATASAKAWEKKWNQASNSKSGVAQGIEQGGVTDLFHIVATRSEKLSEVMPGMLLIVGLLGTFIGLGLALDKASSILGASNAMDAAGAADGLQNMLGMLKGLGTKFKTSTWGIAGFILLKVWSEGTKFEERRLAWVIGKVKQESEARNALLAVVEKEKWNKSVQLGSALTSKMIAAFEKSFERSLQAAEQHNRDLVLKNAEFINAQTNALSEQQNQIAQGNTAIMREVIDGQSAVHALFDNQSRAALQQANEHSDRQEALLNSIAKQHVELIEKNAGALNEHLVQQTHAINEQQKSLALSNANSFRELVAKQTAAYQLMFNNQTDSANKRIQDLAVGIETQLNSLRHQQDSLAKQSTHAMSEMFIGQTNALNERQKEDMRENTRMISLLGDNMQRVADASTQTNKAMQAFTGNTETVVRNMGSAAERMASGADNVGSAAQNLLGAVNEFKQQFTNVLQDVREDLGSAIKNMSAESAKTLTMGSEKLSSATIEISKSLEQLSSDVQGTMTAVQTSIDQALGIQRNASEEIIASSKDFRTGMHEIQGSIEQLAIEIADGLQSISASNVQMTHAVKKMNEGTDISQKISNKLSTLTDSFAHFEGIPPVIDKLVTTLEPMKKIQTSLDDVHKQIASRPAAETGIAREINDKLSRALSPLNDIQSLLKEVRSDLANRPVPQPGVVPESMVKELSHQLQQAIASTNAQRTSSQASASAAALSK